jgi:cell filamentation protein
VNKYNYNYRPPDPYCYPDTGVLINKLNITDGATLHEAERRITALRLAELAENPVRGRFGFIHLKGIHHAIFRDIYTWAGEIRTGEFLTKGDTIFCLGRHIPGYADNLFTKLEGEKKLRGLDKARFIERLAYFMGELNALHPFREGNGRSSREFWRMLSLSAGYDLDFGLADNDELLEADVAAFDKNYAPLITILSAIIMKKQ